MAARKTDPRHLPLKASIRAHEMAVLALRAEPTLEGGRLARKIGIRQAQLAVLWAFGVPRASLPPLLEVAAEGNPELRASAMSMTPAQYQSQVEDRARAAAQLRAAEIAQAAVQAIAPDLDAAVGAAVNAAANRAEHLADVAVARAQSAVLDAAVRITNARARIAEVAVKIEEGRAKSLEEELLLVDNARKSSLNMLGKAVAMMQAAAGPLKQTAESIERLALGDEPMGALEGIKPAERLLDLTTKTVDLGERSMRLRRKLTGDPEVTLRTEVAGGGADEMPSDAELIAAFEQLAPVVSAVQALPKLRLVAGGGVSMAE